MSNLFQTKALLAKLLAKENLFVEERRVNTASFDLNSRVLSIPILKNTLQPYQYDLFIGHEVGHALFTPPGNWKDAIVNKKIPKSVINVVEDARIERKIKTRYPGLKNSFIRAYRELYDQNFFETDGDDINKYNFIDRANLHYKIGVALGVEFKNDKELGFIEEIDNAETFEDVIVVSEKIAEYMREEVKSFEAPKKVVAVIVPKPDKAPEAPKPQDKIETLDDVDELLRELEEALDEAKKQNSGKSDEESKSSDEESEGKDQQGQESDEDDANDESNASGNDTITVGELDEDEQEELINDLIESKTDTAQHINERNLYDVSGASPTFMNIPKIDMSKVVVPYKVFVNRISQKFNQIEQDRINKDYLEYSKSLSKVVSYLLKEFELRKNADQQKRTKISKTGEIDTKRLHAYRLTDDIFKRLATVPDGKSHGLVLFLDWSGSMGNSIKNTIRQLLSLVMFCKKANIPFDVYAFTDNFDGVFDRQPLATLKNKDMFIDGVKLINLFSSRMSASEFRTVASLMSSDFVIPNTKLIMKMNGTPLNEAIVGAMDIVTKFKQQHRVQIVNTVFLTDGESTNGVNYYDPNAGFTQYNKVNIPGDYTITDPVTRFSQTVKQNGSTSHKTRAIRHTQALLNILKHRTGVKVVGFFLVSQRDFKSVIPYYKEYNEWLKGEKDFSDNKCTFVQTDGYDEFYFIKDESQDMNDFSDVEVKNTSVRSVLAAFKKHSTNKIQSRTVLNRFIKVIS